MATLFKEGATYLIQFSDGNGKRPKIRLGKMPKKAAETVLSHVETMLACRLANRSYPPEVSTWLGGIPNDMLKKLAKVDLAAYERHTTGELWSAFRKQKKGVKKSTLNVYDYAEQRFFAFFDRNADLRKLVADDFTAWGEFLQAEYRSPRVGKPLKESTVAGAITKAKAVFNWAVSKKWIDSSPLKGVSRGSFLNPEKDREVTMDEYYRILDVCPCLDWRVIFALARIGGLRPCEILRLRWIDIDWERKRFIVMSPKTERYRGKDKRIVPLFPELQAELLRLLQDECSKGREYVINRYTNRDGGISASTCAKIARRTGIEEFPRPFDNMRASRSTEIYDIHGAHLESKWIGHSKKTAADCYLQVREVDFERAVQSGRGERFAIGLETETVQLTAPVGESKNRVVRIPVQQASESGGTELHEHEKKPTFVGSVDSLPDGATTVLPKRGLEPPLRVTETRT